MPAAACGDCPAIPRTVPTRPSPGAPPAAVLPNWSPPPLSRSRGRLARRGGAERVVEVGRGRRLAWVVRGWWCGGGRLPGAWYGCDGCDWGGRTGSRRDEERIGGLDGPGRALFDALRVAGELAVDKLLEAV